MSFTDDPELRRIIQSVDIELEWGAAPSLIVMSRDPDTDEAPRAQGEGSGFIACCLPDFAAYVRSVGRARTASASVPIPPRWLAIPFAPQVVVVLFEAPPDTVPLPSPVDDCAEDRRVVVMAGTDGGVAVWIRPRGGHGRWWAVTDCPCLRGLAQCLAKVCHLFRYR